MSENILEAGTAYLVVGGELRDFNSYKFADTKNMEIVGIFPSYKSAKEAWKGRTMETVDNALQCYCIIDLDMALKHTCKW